MIATPLPNTYNELLPSDYYQKRLANPLCIVVHNTVGADSRLTLKHGDGRQVSIHKLIQKFPRYNGTTDVNSTERLTSGTVIYTMVQDSIGANHCGFSTIQINGKTYTGATTPNVNQISLGVELENYQDAHNDVYTYGQLLALGYVINNWRAKFGSLPILLHRDIDPTRRKDPIGLTVIDIEYWCKLANEKVTPMDQWERWGTAYPLHKDWAIPQVWYQRASLLGAPISNEYYPIENNAVQYFEHGLVVYNATVNKARAILYSEI